MSPNSRKQYPTLIPFAILAGAILTCIQVLTLERLKLALLRDTAARTSGLAFRTIVPSIIENLRPVDWILITLLVVLLLWLVLREWRGRRVSAELDRVLESDKQTLILLGIMAAASARFYLAPGDFTLGDAPCHMSRVWGATESFANSQWPYWSFYNSAGFPLLQFYGPLFFVMAGAIAHIVGHVEWTTKVLLFLLHAGSAYAVYGWVKSMGTSRHVGFVAGLAYVLTFQHTHTIVWTGALPVALVYFLFPLLLWAMERIISDGSTKVRVVLLSISTAGLILGHNGYAAYSIQLAFLYVMLRWLLPGTARITAARLFTVVLGIGAGVLLCAGFLWPVVVEGKWVYQPMEAPILVPGLPTLEFLKKLVTWRSLFSGWTVAYMGISLVGFAIVGSYLAWRGRRDSRDTASLRTITIVAAFAILCAARAGRVANLALPFIALLCGAVTQIRLSGAKQRLALIIVAVLLLDLGPTTIQSPYRTDRQFLRDGLKHVAESIRPHRTMVGYSSESGTHFYHWGYNDDSGLIQPTGFFPQGAPHSLNTISAMVDALNARDRIPASTLIDCLYLWDVACLVTHARDRFVEPNVTGTEVDRSVIPLARVNPSSPVIFSERVALAADDSLTHLQRTELLLHRDENDPLRQAYLRHIDQWVERMGIDRDKGRADVIFLSSGEERAWPRSGWEHVKAPALYVDEPHDATPHLQTTGSHDETPTSYVTGVPPLSVERYTVGMRHVSIGYESPGEGFLRVAFSWYPTIRVFVDGKEVSPLKCVFGAMVIPTEGGKHSLELVATRSKTWLWSGIAGIGAWLSLTLVAFRRRTKT